MSLSSESSVSNTTPKYLQFTDFTLCPPSVSNGMTVLFALVVLNVMQTVSLQLKKFHAICMSLIYIYYIGYFATHVHLDKTHKYHQQTSNGSTGLHQYNTQLLCCLIQWIDHLNIQQTSTDQILPLSNPISNMKWFRQILAPFYLSFVRCTSVSVAVQNT